MRLFLTFLSLFVTQTSASAGPDFSRDILPILSENCFHCHGPDETSRKGDYRLDTKDGAFRTEDGQANIVAGKSKESELVRRILSHDAVEQMPPPKSNRKLTAKQIQLLQDWIDDGAKWGQHWAYVPLPKVVSIPPVRNQTWPKKTLDHFILAKLETKSWQPAPATTKERWLRRVSFDLTGLPPTEQEVDAFLADSASSAYEKVVDRLLSSQRFGERMATDWLDLARFADTHGYQADRARPMWAYRDWVIQAFNQNLSYDQFLTWQLAGDLLPKPTQEQKIATAFNRLHMQNEEGGIVEEEFRVAYVVDRVNTFGTTFLAQTFECCRCHDHKYDPISQKDFYSLFAFFQNIDESGQTSYFTSSMPVPALPLMDSQQSTQYQKLQSALRTAIQAREQAKEKFRTKFKQWQESKPQLKPATPIAWFDFESWEKNQLTNVLDRKIVANGHDQPTVVARETGKAGLLSGENGFVFPGLGHFSRTDEFSFQIDVRPKAHSPRQVVFHHSMAPIDAGSRGYELLLENGKVAFGLHHMWPGNSLKVRTQAAIPTDRWTQIIITYDGSSQAKGLQIYLDGIVQPLEIIRDQLTKDITYGNEPNLAIGYRFRDNGFKDGQVDNFKLYNTQLTAIDLMDSTKVEKLLPTINEANLFEYYLLRIESDYKPYQLAVTKAYKEENQFLQSLSELMVMQEMPKPKPAYLLKRGNYDQLGNPVSAATPQVLPGMAAEMPRNRLGLSQWLLSPQHPLTARVAVNRFWQQCFGKGLVETSDNFGSTGVPPTHPELLDWLARDFINKKWDIKLFLKDLVLSATYLQSTQTDPKILQEDPYNDLLARATPRRLTAEMLRDQALCVSGLLNEKIGGASVYPYQPEGLWNEAMGRPHYPQSKGADLYRRSLYTFWKRTAPPPTMVTFDAADRSNCSARRQATSTPLQALVLLNDVQYVEAAKILAQRVLQKQSATPQEAIRWLGKVVLGRSLKDAEVHLLTSTYQEQFQYYQANHVLASKLLAQGESKVDPKLDPKQLAAYTQVILMIFNYDEAVYRR